MTCLCRSEDTGVSSSWKPADEIPVLFAIVLSETEPVSLRAKAAGMLPGFGIYLERYLKTNPLSRDQEARLQAIIDQASTEKLPDKSEILYEVRSLINFLHPFKRQHGVPPDP